MKKSFLKQFYIWIFVLLSASGFNLQAQVVNSGLMDTTGGDKINNLTISGYIDSYYGFNFSQPKDGQNPYFVSMNRHNEATINLAYVDLRYQKQRVRARFVPGFGTYMNSNYASETGVMKNLLEASIGYKLFSSKEIWIDFGVLGSPYSNESAISKDHLMYTRSFAPEYVPYYLSGAKVSLPLGKKWNAYLYLINGWQQIEDQNSGKSIGTQLEYRPNPKNLLNWNTYLGDERSKLSPGNRMRYFSDLYWIHNPDGKVSITSCAYLGLQTRIGDTDKKQNDFWWQCNFIARYRFNPKVSLSGRIEYFSDPKGIQIASINALSGFETYSTGLCLNINLSSSLLFRLEGRQFYSDKKQFQNSKLEPVNQSTWLISNLTVWF